jgi:MFS transporter, YQGE family, putative transporter
MLSSALRRLTLVNGFFSLANGLSGLFTTVYLWRLAPGVTTPAIYQLWTMVTVLIAMPLLGKYVKQKGPAKLNAAGMTLYSTFYLVLLLLQDRAVAYLPLLGIWMGLALSAYALATHVLAYDLTDQTNREAYYNRNGLITSVAGLLAPLTSGWLVSSFTGFTGYRLIFIVSALVFGAAAVLGFTLHAARPSAEYRFREAFPGKHPGWHRQLLAYTFMGMRDGLYGFGVNLLVFLATGGERNLGNFTFVTALVGMGAFWVAGRVMTPENRARLFPVGAVLMGLATGMIGLGATWQVMLVMGLLNAVSTPFWQTAWSAVGFDIIRQAAGDRDLRIEMLAAREIPLNLGRLFSLSMLLQFTPTDGSTGLLQVMLASTGLVFLVAWGLVRRYVGAPEAKAA